MAGTALGPATKAASPGVKTQTIYPSIPDPGSTLDTIAPCLLAVKQTLQMIILNAQSPNPNYTPSSASQVFVTQKTVNDLITRITALEKQAKP